MKDRISTYSIADLADIFNPDVQELEDGARILYTFNEDKQPERVRVGDTFIIDVYTPETSFFVSLPADGDVLEGIITPAQKAEGLRESYYLDPDGIEQLVKDISIAYDIGDDDEINKLLEGE